MQALTDAVDNLMELLGESWPFQGLAGEDERSAIEEAESGLIAPITARSFPLAHHVGDSRDAGGVGGEESRGFPLSRLSI